MKKLREPLFIRVCFYETPDSAPDWVGTAVQIGGDDMYGDLILLETIRTTGEHNDLYSAGNRITAAEWEWNGGIPLEGDDLERAKKMYHQNLYKAHCDWIAEKATNLKERLSCWQENEIKLNNGVLLTDIETIENSLAELKRYMDSFLGGQYAVRNS